ncbi:MAG: chitobiase/beta-hexosaminidase C-terminal domain-containing protein, partial [Bacteroidaceae bacterium]|nr:chitobiase/beta-hexosaminidase C-terminal domain-containing protein [Bacteroidaceae bacterium]
MKHFTHYITRLIGVFAMLLACNITAVAEDTYVLVTSASDLAAGDKIIIAANESAYALSTTQNTNNRGQAAITKSTDCKTITNPSTSVQIITLEASTIAQHTGEYFLNVGTDGYLYAANSSKNHLRTQATADANSSATISVTSAGIATIAFQGSYTNNTIYYNSASGLFSCYSSAQKAISIYKLQKNSSVATPTFTPAPGTYTEAQSVTIECATENTEIWYTTDGTDPSATGADYKVYEGPISITKTTTIKALAINDNAEFSNTATAVYTILEDPTNTPETAYTVAEAKAIIDGNYDLTKPVYVKGKISQIDSYNDTYKSITYWISANGSTTDQFEIYSGKGQDGADFDSLDDLELGADVIIYGLIKKYNDTYEFDVNSQIVNYTPTPRCTVTWSANGTTTETIQAQGATLTLPAAPAAIFGYVFVGWTAATSVNPDGTDITYLAADATVPAQESVTYYAVFTKESGLETIKYGWEETEADASSFDTNFLNKNTTISAHTGAKYGANINASNNGVAGNSCYIKTTSKVKATAVEFYYSKASNNTTAQDWVLQTSTDGQDWSTNTTKYSASGATNGKWSKASWTLDGSEVYVKITMSSTGTAIRTIDDLLITYGTPTYSDYTISVPTPVDVTIGSTGFSTIYYSDKNLTVPAGVAGWTYSLNGDALQATESYPAGTTIPAGEGVVLYTTAPATYTFAAVTTAGDKVAGNLLKGSDEATTKYAEAKGNQLYRLANGSKGVAFYLASQDGDSIAISAHKAYLEIPANAAANIREFIMLPGQDDGTTAISAPNAATTTTETFDLAGRRISHATKGLYIINGKKVIK